MRRLWTATLLASLALAAPAGAAKLTLVEDGLSAPMTIAGHPNDASKLYVVERAGVVKLLQAGDATTVLDIQTLVDDSGEGGLLSIALPDDFTTSGRIYAYFTEDTPSGPFTLVVASFLPGDPGSRQDVIRIPHPGATNHNGGQIHFGPDGNLWLATGDGGGGGDPNDNAENPNRLLGKVLRITPKAGGGYDVPAGNPFRAGGGAPEVWATGLRNPFRFSFDRVTGDLWIGDVGQGDVEEIDVARASAGLGCGASYGWNTFEGDRVFESGPVPANYLAPFFVHTDTEDPATPYGDDFRSITGGLVVRDPALANDLAGRYLYTDYLRIGDHLFSADAAAGGPRQESLTLDGVTGFGEDAAGRVYAASLNQGTVHRVAPDAGPDVPAGAPARFALAGCEPPPREEETGGGGQQQPPAQPGAEPPLTPPAPAVLLDRTAPRVSLLMARRQRLRNRTLLVRAACGEPCTLMVSAKVRGRSIRAVRRRLAAGTRATVRMRLGPSALAAVRRARRPVATITVRALDAAGNVTRRTARVTIVR